MGRGAKAAVTKSYNKPRPACLACSKRKRACVRWPTTSNAEEEGSCEWCLEIGVPCEPQLSDLTRRERDKLEKSKRWRAARQETKAREQDEGGEAEMPSESLDSGIAGQDSPEPHIGSSSQIPDSTHSNAIEQTNVTSLSGARPNMSASRYWFASPEAWSAFSSTSTSARSMPRTRSASPPLSRTMPMVTPVASIPLNPLGSSYSSQAGDRSHEDLVLPSLAGYWDSFHIANPFLHKRTFEEAFTNRGSAFYGLGKRPVALLYALAGTGVRFADLPSSISASERLQYCRAYYDRAKTLLLAGYFTDQPTMSDLEATQTMYLLYHYAVLEKTPADGYMVLERGLHVLRKICQSSDVGDGLGKWGVGLEPPRSAQEWVLVEMLLRLYILYFVWDAGQSYVVGRDLIHDFFSEPIVIPGEDSAFALPAETAFEAIAPRIAASESYSPWTVVDLSPLSSLEVDPLVARTKIHELVTPIFERRASHLANVCVLASLRTIRGKLRSFTIAKGIDTIELASADGPDSPVHTTLVPPSEQDSDNTKTENEFRYRRYVTTWCGMVEQITESMPPELGAPLRMGDAVPLLRTAYLFWPDIRYACAFLDTHLSCRGLHLENWMPNMSVNPPLDFFRSARFLSVLEAGIVVCRIMEGLMSYDSRGLRQARMWTIVPAMRVGGLHVAAAKMCGDPNQAAGGVASEAFKADARVVCRWLEAVGLQFRPLGRQLALNFRKVMKESGIEPEAITGLRLAPITVLNSSASTTEQDEGSIRDAPPVEAEAVVEEVPASFMGTVQAVETWIKPFLR